MKTIIKFYVLAFISALLLTATACNKDSEPGVGQCYKIFYDKISTAPFIRETSRQPVNLPSTNGYIDMGSYVYEVKCY